MEGRLLDKDNLYQCIRVMIRVKVSLILRNRLQNDLLFIYMAFQSKVGQNLLLHILTHYS